LVAVEFGDISVRAVCTEHHHYRVYHTPTTVDNQVKAGVEGCIKGSRGTAENRIVIAAEHYTAGSTVVDSIVFFYFSNNSSCICVYSIQQVAGGYDTSRVVEIIGATAEKYSGDQ